MRSSVPGVGGESSNEGGAITGPVESVIPLLNEEGQGAWFSCGHTEVKQPRDVRAGRWCIFKEHQIPQGVLAEIGDGCKGRAIAGTAKVYVSILEDVGALSTCTRSSEEVNHEGGGERVSSGVGVSRRY